MWLKPDEWQLFTSANLFIILGMPCHCKPKHMFKNSLFCLTTLSSSNDAGMSIIIRPKKRMRIISQMVDN